jgi:Gamma-glutamyltranspeptidase
MVALITSITASFGALVAVPGTGILLNNGMGAFDPRPGRPNSIAPGKMPIFAVPTLVALENGRAVFAAAGAGGYRITTGVQRSSTGGISGCRSPRRSRRRASTAKGRRPTSTRASTRISALRSRPSVTAS